MPSFRRALLIGLVAALASFSASPVQSQTKSLVIGIDGLGYGEQGFSVADTPWLDSIISGNWASGYNGAYSDQAFAGGVLGTPTQQITVSGPGWSTMLTGVWTDRHHVTGNGATFANGDFDNNPAYLGTLKEAIPSLTTASYVNWTPIDAYIISALDSDGVPGNSVDFHQSYDGGGGSSAFHDTLVASAAAAGIADVNGLDPDAVFVSFDQVDAGGHSCGSSNSCYRASIESVDGLVGQLLNAVKSRPDFANEEWQIVVTADHGHLPNGGHGGQSEIERTIPFIVSSEFLNQGTLPIFPQQVSHADLAPTVLDHFNVPLPERYWGVSRASGSVSINPDINGDGIVSGDGSGAYGDDDVVAFISWWLKPNSLEDPNPADLNLDGITNLEDWSVLNAQLPQMGAAIFAALGRPVAPEPPAFLVAIVCAAAFASVRRFVVSSR